MTVAITLALLALVWTWILWPRKVSDERVLREWERAREAMRKAVER